MSGLLPENKDVPHYLRLCGFGPVLGFWFCFKNLTCHWRNRANKSRPYFSPGKRNFGKIAGFVFRSSLQYIYLEQKLKAEEGVFSILALVLKNWSGKRDSNPRPSPWQGDYMTFMLLAVFIYLFNLKGFIDDLCCLIFLGFVFLLQRNCNASNHGTKWTGRVFSSPPSPRRTPVSIPKLNETE